MEAVFSLITSGLKVSRQDELPRSRRSSTGLLCVLFCHLDEELWGPTGINLTSSFTVTVVKLWHTVDGLYMWVFPETQVSRHHVA